MKRKIKVAIVSPYFLFPVDSGGRIRTFSLAHSLSQLDLEIHILAPLFTLHSSSIISINNNLKVYPINYPCAILPFLLGDRPFPFMFLASFHPGYRIIVRKYLKIFDIYQFEHASFADLTDYIPPQKIIIYDAHNVEYDYVKSECQTRFIETVSLRKIYNLENKLIQRSAKILACSQENKERFIELYHTDEKKISIIPNGISHISIIKPIKEDIAIKIFPGLSRYKKRVLFSGSNVRHNWVAVKFILDKLAPQLRESCAFIIKGACAKKFRRYKSTNVFIDPKNGSITPYACTTSTVAINPITQGSGTSLKVLEYLAHHLPVISTEFGMRGYDDLKPFVMLSNLDGFAQAILREYSFPKEATQLLKKYLWSNIAVKLRNIYLSLWEKNKRS